MSERSPRFCSWWTLGLGVTVGHYYVHVHGHIALSGRGCTVWSFTTLGECGLSLSLRLRPMKTHSSNQEMKSN